MVFHGKERMDEHTRAHLQESPRVVTVPLILLAVPSVLIGLFTVGPMVFGGFFDDSIIVHRAHDVLAQLGQDYTGPIGFILHGLVTPPVYLAAAGFGTAWYLYIRRPELPAKLQVRFRPLHTVLERKYGFDDFYQTVFAGGSRALGSFFSRVTDARLIDDMVVNGTARGIGRVAAVLRQVQTGYLYHYAFAMIIGLVILLTWFVFGAR